MGSVDPWNDQRSDIEKQHIFRFGYECRVAVDQRPTHASSDKAVLFYVLHGEAAGKHGIVMDHCGPGAAAMASKRVAIPSITAVATVVALRWFTSTA